MSIFDDIEAAGLDSLIASDMQVAGLYRYDPGGGVDEDDNPLPANDGFNAEYKHELGYVKQIEVSIARSGTSINTSNYSAATKETDINEGDILEVVNKRGQKRRYTVTAFEPVKDHTLLQLDEVKNG